MAKKTFAQKQMYLGAYGVQISRNDYYKEKRREVVSEGFPVTEPFTSREQIEEYLSGDTIQCLICGREFSKSLGKHLNLHDLSPDQYKIKYGMTRKTKLTTKHFQKSRAENMTPSQMTHIAKLGKIGYKGTNREAFKPEWLKKEMAITQTMLNKKHVPDREPLIIEVLKLHGKLGARGVNVHLPDYSYGQIRASLFDLAKRGLLKQTHEQLNNFGIPQYAFEVVS